MRRRGAIALGLAFVGVAVAVLLSGGADESDDAGPQPRSKPPAAKPEAESEPQDGAPTVTGFDGPVPILMYHAIQPAPPDAALPDLYVPQAELSEQVRWLAAEGYTAVTLESVIAAWERGDPIPERPVVLSFDDGLRSQYVGALPVLDAQEWPGVLNLKVESLTEGELTEAMVRELIDKGWELASHTLTHADVSGLSGEALRREVTGSRRELGRRFDVPVRSFCYPAGRYDDEAVAAVRDAGYESATTTDPGLARPGDPYRLARIRVNPGDGVGGLRRKLGAG